MLNEQEQERFMRLWTTAQPAVGHYVHAMVRDPAAAEDLVQETALVLYRRFGEYDNQRPFLSWALGVAEYQVLGFHRDAARSFVTFDSELFDKLTEMWSEAALLASDKVAALESCLERLGARPRQILRLRYVDNLRSQEIATRLGTRGAGIRVVLQRIREQLRACVERQLHGEGGA